MLTDFQFASAHWLWLFIPIIGLMYTIWRQRVSDQQAGQGIIAEHLANVFSVQNSQRASKLPILMTLVIASIIIVALAGPSWLRAGDDKIKSPLIIALDLSPSMIGRRGEITRLEYAKLLVTAVLKQAANRPISLVAFAGSSHQVLPPSEQFELLTLYLGYMAPEVMPLEGNNLDSIISVLNATPAAQEFGFDILIVTDGVDGPSRELAGYLASHKAHGIVAALSSNAEELANQLNLELITSSEIDKSTQQAAELVAKLAADAIAKSSILVNQGYWLLYPAALLLLLFFRRGFNLYWTPAVLLSVSLVPVPAQANWLDWFVSADQQGQYYFDRGDYQEAAIRFNDLDWKALSYYKAKEYRKAAKIYRSQATLQSLFNLAMTYTRGRNYTKAQQLYELLLEIEPDNQAAQNNLRIVKQLIRDIKQLGESQQEESPPESIDADEMIDSNLGADKQTVGKVEVKLQRLSVSELLKSDSKKQQWLRDISKDPQQFLASKFQAEFNKSFDSTNTDMGKQPSSSKEGVDD